MSWDEVCARRLARHGLFDGLPSVAAACAVMCGAHAQIMTAAELSVGLRTGCTRSDVAAALWHDREVVKTFGPRGTVHLLPTRDLATWCAALDAVPKRSSMPAAIKLDAAQTDAVVAAVGAALSGAELGVAELDAAVVGRVGEWAGELCMPAFGGFWPRWRQAIGAAATRGVLCFGPNRGRLVTYTNPATWVASRPGMDDPVGWLIAQYLHAYGPATPAHVAQWLAAPTTWAREQFDRLDLDEVVLDGAPAWVNHGDTEFGQSAHGTVLLLPYFDAFAVGSHPRHLLYPGRAAERALAGSQAGNFPVLLIDGVVAGVWHQRRTGSRLAITVEPLRALSSPHRRAVAAEVDRIAMMGRARAELTIGTVTVGPHA